MNDRVPDLARARAPVDCRVAIRTPARAQEEPELLGADVWRVRHVEIEEEIDAPYTITALLITEDVLLDTDRLLGGELELELRHGAEDDERTLHGVIHRVDYVGTHARQLFVRIVAGPALTRLARTRRSRIFQGLGAVAIVQAVVRACFESSGRTLVVDRLSATYPPIDYCVQHRETDLRFLQRVLAEAGIAYVWDHQGEHEALVLVDRNESLVPLGLPAGEDPGDEPPTLVPMLTGSVAGGDIVGLSQLRWTRQLRTAAHEAAAWDARECVRLLGSVSPAEPDPWEIGERYEHDERRLREDDAGHVDDLLARAERTAARSVIESAGVDGVGNILHATAGATFEIHGHPSPHLDRQFFTTRVVHRIDIPAADVMDDGLEGAPHYEHELSARPLEHEYRPAPVRRPSIPGPQLATVVGPPGEEIHTDALGRIRVWLHWDREGEASGGSELSCWIRVAQLWAGPGYGTWFLPRVGMEVVVSFLDGDPDRPLVSGCVYNGQHPPPYALPEERTKTTLRTATSPGGVAEGYNELRFEDAKGREQVYLHAQRSFDERVGARHTTHVGGDQTLTVHRDRNKKVEGSETRTIEGSRQTAIGGSDGTTIGGGRRLEVQCAPAAEGGPPGIDETRVHGERHLWAQDRSLTAVGPSAGTPTTLEITPQEVLFRASHRFVIEVGGTTLEITPEGIRLAGKKIDLAAEASALVLDKDALLRSDNFTKVKQGVAALELRDNKARLKSRFTKLQIMTGPTAACIELGDDATIKGKAVVAKTTEGDSRLSVRATSISSNAENQDHNGLTAYKVKSLRIDLN